MIGVYAFNGRTLFIHQSYASVQKIDSRGGLF